MATQGLLGITKGNKMLFKIIAGCNGYNINKLIPLLNCSSIIKMNSKELYELILPISFGCSDCLVVMGKRDHYTLAGELGSDYRDTFKQVFWNPRWSRGTADYSMSLDITAQKVTSKSPF